MPTRPKQQHYVTRAYLEGFVEPGRESLFCYGRHRRSPFQSRPTDLARQHNYYSLRRPDATWDDSLEHEIEQRVEAPGLEIIRQLSLGNTRLGWPERDALAMLMAVQRFRVPHLRQIIDASHAEMIRGLLSEYDQRERDQPGGRLWIRSISPMARPGDPERPKAYVSREDLEDLQASIREDPGRFSRETLFGLAVSFAKVFRRMKWTLYRSNENSPFVTSDCPILLRHERGDVEHAGIVRPDTCIEFPLCRNALLSMTHDFALIDRAGRHRDSREARKILRRVPEIRVAQADGERVDELNVNQARYCSKWTFCGRQSDSLIEILREPSRNVRQSVIRDGDFFRFEVLTGQS